VRRIALACLFLFCAATTGRAASRAIDVAVEAPPSVSDTVLADIFAEAGAIWAPADVVFRWHRSVHADTTRSDYLLVTIDASTPQPRDAQAALGWITFETGRPGRSIHLALANAEALIHRTPTARNHTAAEHDALLGRALGRALAHETGHYLLQSKAHTAHGLMRSSWPSEEFLAVDRSRFGLAAEERAAVAWVLADWATGGVE